MSYYEVVYYYHERLPDGKWNTDERHEMKKKIGGPADEVSIDKLAAIILAQLAKRDKLVVDVEVYEYAKRKIHYKEATDGSGIVLKNKKFSTNSIAGQIECEELGVEDEESCDPRESPTQPRKSIEMKPNSNKIQTWMTFDPELPLQYEAEKNGLRFTVGKKYPVYDMGDHPSGVGSVLTVMDDTGKRLCVPDKFFVTNTRIRLVGDDEVEGGFDPPPKKGEPRLSYDRQYIRESEMPNIRPNLAR